MYIAFNHFTAINMINAFYDIGINMVFNLDYISIKMS